jgi:8-oxo-dGTP diphosphatase
VLVIVSENPVIRCVGAVIHDSSGRLLLVKRAHEPGRGRWSLPGGRVEPGETDHSAVQREVFEETGLSVTVGPLLGRILRPAPRGTYEILDYSCWTTESDLFPGDDAADAIWADGATFATLERESALTEGLADVLRSWNCLPRNE